MKGFALFFLCATLSLAPAAQAACTTASLKGKFVGTAVSPETDAFYAAHSIISVYFNGAGGVTVGKLVEVGEYGGGTASGSGSYIVYSNCTGRAEINLKQNGVIVGQSTIDFTLGNTKALPQMHAVYRSSNGSTGTITLQKSMFF
jgi:hypothetical protein